MPTAPDDMPTWASDATYSSGPDVGIATRLEPTSGDKAGGFMRRFRAPARKLNWVVGLLCDWVAYLKAYQEALATENLAKFGTFREHIITPMENPTVKINALGRNPLNGRYYFGGFEPTSDDLLLFAVDDTVMTEGNSIANIANTGTHASYNITFEPADDVASEPGLYLAASLDGDNLLRVWRSNSGGDPDAFVAVGTADLGDVGPHGLAMAHDADNDSLIVVASVKSSTYGYDIHVRRVVDAASPALSTPSSEPTYDNGNPTIVAAAGGGRILMGWVRRALGPTLATTLVFYTSTDGGDTITATGTVTATSGPTESPLMGDLQYYESFLSEGAGFVCSYLQQDGGSGYEIEVMFSTDGASWATVATIAVTGSAPRPRLFGEYVVAEGGSNMGTGSAMVYSIATGEGYVVNNGVLTSAGLTRDRDMTRIVAMTSTELSITNPLRTPRSLAGAFVF